MNTLKTTPIAHIASTVVIAGALATVAFDFFGQTLSPLMKDVAAPWLGSKLAPVGLAQSSLVELTGIEGKTLRAYGIPHGLHILTGLLAYPLGWLLVARPAWQAIAPRLHWSVPAAAYGVGLFVFALYVMAHLVAGMPAFLGWGGITWVALWGHIVFALVAAGVIQARMPVARPEASGGAAVPA